MALGLGHNHLAGAERTGSPPGEVYSQLGMRISAIWKGQSLGVVLDRLAVARDITFWVDRRVDIQRPIDGHFRDVPLRDVLNSLTKDGSLGWSDLGNICYVGPQDAAHEIATLIELAKDSVQELPTRKKDTWLRESMIGWPRLSEPGLLLKLWLEEQGIELVHPELIEHDLWAAKKLPTLSLVDRVVLLLVGFDLTCQISPDGDKCNVVAIERPVTIAREYDAGRKSRSVVEQMSRKAPELLVQQTGNRLSVRGRWEDHKKLMGLLSGSSSGSSDRVPQKSSQQRQLFSLRLKNQPLGKVITQIAHQLGLEVVWENDLLDRDTDPREQLVSCEVQEADLSILLDAIVHPLGIDYRLQDGRLTLIASEQDLESVIP
ncbi:hypothetical protein [Bythopirellula goksoeyrii]|nr:hypothetical protein [Bythopirellula goksoeyrii]